MKKAFITGISGFAGSFLAEHLLNNGETQVFGSYLLDKSLQNLISIKNKLHLEKIDLTIRAGLLNFLNKVKPDYIYHLAALTSPGDSFRQPVETLTNNIAAQLNLLESIREAGLNKVKILIVSSGDTYGAVDKQDLPIDEDTPFKPLNPYSVSKIAQDYLGLQYFLSYGLQIVRVRPFNHIGPRQSPSFVVASFAKQIAKIEKGQMEPVLRVGNLNTRRDFTDVRDMVKAYELILEKGKAGEVYNIGSGKSYTIEEILQKLLSFSKSKIRIEKDLKLFRPNDTQELLCDSEKCKRTTGWKPSILIEKTLEDTLDYWRKIV